MGAIKRQLEDTIDYIAWNVVDYGLAYDYEKHYSWQDIQWCADRYLWDNLCYVEMYNQIANNNRFSESEKNDLCSTLFMGLAETMANDNVMQLLEV